MQRKFIALFTSLVAVCGPLHAADVVCSSRFAAAGTGAFLAIDESPIIVLDPVGIYVPAGRDYFATQMFVAARDAAIREDALRARLARNQNLFGLADQAEQTGDIKVAARLYRRISLSRPRTEVTVTAQDRLSKIQGAAQSKLQSLEDQLNALTGKGSVPSAFQTAKIDNQKVIDIFADLDKLALEYAGVDSIENKIQERTEKLRRQKQFAAVLQEPAANELLKSGQRHEEAQQLCCAYLAYEQAAFLLPAPSGEQAKARMAKLEAANKSIVSDANNCRNLQLCHEKFRRAMSIKTTAPNKARTYFSEIIELAPPDTSVHKAAREQIAMLR